MTEMERREVLVIGAGPSGAIAAALLKRKGHDVLIVERQHFPRFSIGESLLSHCLDFVEEAGMLDAVNDAGFQLKNGAAFAWGERYSAFDFGKTFSNGKPTTFQVQRAEFDKLLADQAALQGVEIRYGEEIVAADFSCSQPSRRRQRVPAPSPLRPRRQRLRPRAAAPAGPGGTVGFPGAPGGVHPHRGSY